MKRRNFLINSIATFSGCTLFSGCTKEKVIKKEGSIARNKFKDTEVPMLGFGCMRLPVDNKNEIDMVELDRMVEYAISHGANYFDTAFMYVNSKSENAIGEILKKYPRNSYYLADKAPISRIREKEDIRKIFNEQLKRCKVDYFDFYLAHGIKEDVYGIYKDLELHSELLKLKQEGKIKYLGFSFHGTIEILKEVIAEGNWDFCQLQLNYLDWNVAKGKKQYEIASSANLPVIVMEPLGGGILANSYDNAMEELRKKYPDTTPAEFGLRWAASLDNVAIVLSGMSNLEQVKQNIKTFENFKAMTQDEKEIAKKIAKIIRSQGEINCTGCKYCLEVCPKGVNIPEIFNIYNRYRVFKKAMMIKTNYEALSKDERAENCIECGLCSKKCPQGLKIPELLAGVLNEYRQAKKSGGHRGPKA